MSFEDDLRVTLRDRATAATPPADLLTGITTGVRRDRRRRRLVAAGAAVVATVTALAVPLTASGREPNLPGLLPAAPVPGPSVQTWTGPWRPTTSFPLRPGWVPGDAGPAQVFQVGPNRRLHYEKDRVWLSTEVGPAVPDWRMPPADEHVAVVGGQPATVRTAENPGGAGAGGRYVAVRWWAPRSGLWTLVSSVGPRTEQEVLRFARELGSVPGDVPAGPGPFTFARVPPLLTTQYQTPEAVCLVPRQQRQQKREPEGLCVSVLKASFEQRPDSERLTVGGRAADLHRVDGSLTVDLGDGRVLTVAPDPARVPLSRTELLRFAEGVTYHPS